MEAELQQILVQVLDLQHRWKLNLFSSSLRLPSEHEVGRARAVQMFVQARIIKHLLFSQQSGSGRWMLDRLKEDLDSTTSHLPYLSMGNFVCLQVRSSPVSGHNPTFIKTWFMRRDQDSGFMTRSDVGYLHWSWEQMERDRLPQVGSMLKTPQLPVWVCCVNGSYSVLFSQNRLLLSDWKTEHLFHLFYYNRQTSQKMAARLTVGEDHCHTGSDTHSHHWEASSRNSEGDPEKRFPSLEMTTRTKWDGAAIDWNDTLPFH